MPEIELKPCPFCGNAVNEYIGVGGVHFYKCSYIRCGAIISFGGSKRLLSGAFEAEKPRENFNRRADNA